MSKQSPAIKKGQRVVVTAPTGDRKRYLGRGGLVTRLQDRPDGTIFVHVALAPLAISRIFLPHELEEEKVNGVSLQPMVDNLPDPTLLEVMEEIAEEWEWRAYLKNHPRVGRRVSGGHISYLRDAGRDPNGNRTWQEVVMNDNGHTSYGLYSPAW